MKQWLIGEWRALEQAVEPRIGGVWRHATGSALGVGLVALVAALAYVPTLAVWSGLHEPAQALGALLVGSAAAALAAARRGRGALAGLSTSVQSFAYALGLSLAAARSRGDAAVCLALLLIVVMATAPRSSFGWAPLGTLVFGLPTLLVVLWLEPPPLVALLLLCGPVATLLAFWRSARIERRLRSVERLEVGLAAFDRALQFTHKRLLASSLSNAGTFLHELRNLEAAVRMNLEFLSTRELGDTELTAAVQEALRAVHTEQALLSSMLETLRARGELKPPSLIVEDVVRSLVEQHAGVPDLHMRPGSSRFRVEAESEHLAFVLRELVRNARQAGATRVDFEFELGPGGTSMLLAMNDNGPGLAPELLDELNDGRPAALKAELGLGLHLCKRYLELMRATLLLQAAEGGGVRVEIRLPGVLMAGTPPRGSVPPAGA